MAHAPTHRYRRLMERASEAARIIVAYVPLQAWIVTERENPSDPFSPITRQYEIGDSPGVVYLRFKKRSGFTRWLHESGYGQTFEDSTGFWLPVHHLGVPKEVTNWRRRQEAAAVVAAAIFRGEDEECEIWINAL